MKNTNNIIKSFDYSNDLDIEQLQVVLNEELSGLPLLTTTINKGQKIFRVRNIKKVEDYPLFEKDISYRRDIENIKDIGRCNWTESSRFYGSIQSKIEEFPGDVTAMAEISELSRKDKEGSEQYAVGVWKANENFNLMVVRPPLIHYSESKEIPALREAFKTEIRNMSDGQNEFYELYGSEMIKKVAPNENDNYAISALISETILNYQDGIIYTSVQSDHKGLNVVMKPQVFDKRFTLESVVVGEFYKFKNISAFRATLACTDLYNTPFKYLPATGKDYTSNEELIALFESKGISHDYMVKALKRQMEEKRSLFSI